MSSLSDQDMQNSTTFSKYNWLQVFEICHTFSNYHNKNTWKFKLFSNFYIPSKFIFYKIFANNNKLSQVSIDLLMSYPHYEY